MQIKHYVVRKDWGFEVYEEIKDEKQKVISRRQSGAGVCKPEDVVRMVTLMDPFREDR